MSVIAFIPVRGGSKSIPLKNIKPFCGKPLVYWTAKAADDASCVERLIIASDSEKILETAKNFGLAKLELYERDEANAQDSSSTESVMLEYIAKAGLDDDDIFILVQATSPLTSYQDIESAMKLYASEHADSLLTCSRTKRFFWHPDGKSANYDFTDRPRRQDFPGTLMENGAFYISTVKAIRESGCRLSGKICIYEMPEYCGTEIDEPEDWLITEKFMRKYRLTLTKENLHVIKLFASDIDGVLTDGGMYYSESGDELKRFHTHDGKGLELLHNAGIMTALITSENMSLNSSRAAKLRVDFVLQGVSDKLSAMTELCRKLDIALENTAYIGDDLNDIELLANVGLPACPVNAVDAVKNMPGILQLTKSGGHSAVREFCEYIMQGW